MKDLDGNQIYLENFEYLIKQTQYSLNNMIRKNEKNRIIDLHFNHPILELIFVVQSKSKFIPRVNGGNDYFNFSKTDKLFLSGKVTHILWTIKFIRQ